MFENVDINNRVRILRKKLNFTQIEFANKIGITQGTLSGIEKGNVSLSNQNIVSICREFEVYEEWLRTGKGNMFILFDENDLFSMAVTKVLKNEDDFTKNMFIEMAKWSQEDKNIIKEAIKIIKRSNF